MTEKRLTAEGYERRLQMYEEEELKKAHIRVRARQGASLYEIDKLIKEFKKWQMETLGMSVEDFFKEKQEKSGDCVGAYILYNLTNGMHYVGQATRLYFRVNQHLTGHGNGDVYADLKNGDEFRVILIKLTESGYDDLDKLERDMIEEYDAYHHGYNKTVGNGY